MVVCHVYLRFLEVFQRILEVTRPVMWILKVFGGV